MCCVLLEAPAGGVGRPRVLLELRGQMADASPDGPQVACLASMAGGSLLAAAGDGDLHAWALQARFRPFSAPQLAAAGSFTG